MTIFFTAIVVLIFSDYWLTKLNASYRDRTLAYRERTEQQG